MIKWNPENEFSFSPLTIYETIVTTADSNTTNFAPMGVWFNKKGIRVKPYTKTKTFELISRNKECVVNISWDVRLFAIGALKLSIEDFQPKFERCNLLKTQRLTGCNAWFECKVDNIIIQNSQRAEIRLDVIHFEKKNQISCPNRADAAIIEAIIHSTRLPYCRTETEEKKLRNLITLNLQLASRISNAEHHQRTIQAISNKISSKEGTFPAN